MLGALREPCRAWLAGDTATSLFLLTIAQLQLAGQERHQVDEPASLSAAARQLREKGSVAVRAPDSYGSLGSFVFHSVVKPAVSVAKAVGECVCMISAYLCMGSLATLVASYADSWNSEAMNRVR